MVYRISSKRQHGCLRGVGGRKLTRLLLHSYHFICMLGYVRSDVLAKRRAKHLVPKWLYDGHLSIYGCKLSTKKYSPTKEYTPQADDENEPCSCR